MLSFNYLLQEKRMYIYQIVAHERLNIIVLPNGRMVISRSSNFFLIRNVGFSNKFGGSKNTESVEV